MWCILLFIKSIHILISHIPLLLLISLFSTIVNPYSVPIVQLLSKNIRISCIFNCFSAYFLLLRLYLSITICIKAKQSISLPLSIILYPVNVASIILVSIVSVIISVSISYLSISYLSDKTMPHNHFTIAQVSFKVYSRNSIK